MKTESVLTPEEIDALLDGVLRASGSAIRNYTIQKSLDEMRGAVTAIEQAVLESAKVQALRDALEDVSQWMDSQADAQSKGGHATLDIMMLREKRDIARAALAAMEKQP